MVTFTGGLGDADGTEDDWMVDTDDGVEEEVGVDPVQLPKDVWHPAPQYAEVEPLC
jgi:hypothetical protein